MDIWRLLAAVIRRWYIIIPLFVATTVAALTIQAWVQPEYKTSAIISIVQSKAPPQTQTESQAANNPYISPSFSAGVLQHVLNSSETRQEMLTNGLAGSYQVKAVPRSSFLGIDVTASDPEIAIATARGVIEGARQVLIKRQTAAGAPANSYVSIDVLDDADSVAASISGRTQALAAVLAAGVIVSVIITVLIDDLLLLRRRRPVQNVRRRHAQNAEVEPKPSGNGVAHEGTLNHRSTVDQDTERLRPTGAVNPTPKTRG